MPEVRFTTPTTRSSNVLGTVANSLANNAESSTITIDNSADKFPYIIVTLKLGSITPTAGGTVSLRVTLNDGTDTGDKVGGEVYTLPLTSGASAKVNVLRFAVPGVSLRLSLINNSGVTLAGSGNELYYRFFSEAFV
jgi:hypothetical protein